MTFSEYIANYAWKQYLDYCSKNSIQPILDTDLKRKKVCALCTKKPTEKKDA